MSPCSIGKGGDNMGRCGGVVIDADVTFIGANAKFVDN